MARQGERSSNLVEALESDFGLLNSVAHYTPREKKRRGGRTPVLQSIDLDEGDLDVASPAGVEQRQRHLGADASGLLEGVL